MCTLSRPLSLIGDGFCDTSSNFNTHACGWDGGDCCEDSCVEGAGGDCDSLFVCRDPLSSDFAGTLRTPSMSSCAACSAGRYADTSGESECLLCPVGRYSDADATTMCKQCDPGHFAGVVGLTECAACELGEYTMQSGQSSCDYCAIGTHASVNGSTACNSCIPGKFSNNTRNSNCVDCRAGMYRSNADQLAYVLFQSSMVCEFCLQSRRDIYCGERCKCLHWLQLRVLC